MPDSSIPATAALLRNASRIAVISHIRPDGDAYGSAIGLGLSLLAMGKTVHIFNQDGLIPMHSFLPGSERLESTPTECPGIDLLVSLDTSTFERLGKHCVDWKREVDINIDHHVSNTLYGKHNLIRSDVPATAAIVAELIQTEGLPVSPDIASNLFVGMSTDTGSFRFRGTTAATFRLAAWLVDSGADAAELAKQCYQSMTPERFKLQQLCMQKLTFEQEDQLAYFTITPDMFRQTGALPEDTEGVVESAQAVRTVRLAALFEIRENNSLKVSLRSKGDFNVNDVACHFGGGGHPQAAGINFSSDAEDNIQRVLEHLRACFTAS